MGVAGDVRKAKARWCWLPRALAAKPQVAS